MGSKKVFIISGDQGAGKTTCLKDVLKLLQQKGRSIGGFMAEGTWKNNKRNAFTLINVRSGETVPLCSAGLTENWFQVGRFFFNPDAIVKGEAWLGRSVKQQDNYIVLDEIGIFELEGKIWHNIFQQLLTHCNSPLIITVRKRILHQIIEKYQLENPAIFYPGVLAEKIVEKLESSKE